MNTRLKGSRIAILATNGFEQAELLHPRQALDEEGAETIVVSPEKGRIRGWTENNWGRDVPVDLALDSANADNFSALLLPGGVMNPDKLRMIPKALQFVTEFFRAGKPIAAICHGPWLLVEADIVRDHTLTSWPSLRTDIRNAGGIWVDREVAQDRGLITSRKPADIPAFNKAIIEELTAARPAPARMAGRSS